MRSSDAKAPALVAGAWRPGPLGRRTGAVQAGTAGLGLSRRKIDVCLLLAGGEWSRSSRRRPMVVTSAGPALAYGAPPGYREWPLCAGVLADDEPGRVGTPDARSRVARPRLTRRSHSRRGEDAARLALAPVDACGNECRNHPPKRNWSRAGPSAVACMEPDSTVALLPCHKSTGEGTQAARCPERR